jgi:hypothetical protein
MTKESFIANLPKGYKYRADIQTGVLGYRDHGTTYLSPEFFEQDKLGRKLLYLHEEGHDLARNFNEDWKDVLEPFRIDKDKPLGSHTRYDNPFGANTRPEETIADLYSVLHTGEAKTWESPKYRNLIGKAIEVALKQGKHVPADVVKEYSREIKGTWAQQSKPKLVGIEWRSKIGEKFDPKEGGLVEAKVSDWEQKAKSTASQRDIVHVYLIEGVDGEVKPYGKQAAMKELGIVEPRKLDKQATELMRKQQYDEGQRKARVDGFKNRATYGSVADANRAFLVKLPHQTAMDDMNKSSVYENDGKYLTTWTGNEEDVLGAGYKKVRDNGSPIKVEFKTGGWRKGKARRVAGSPKVGKVR